MSENNDGFIIIKNVRVSFPHLFEFPEFKDGPGKCGARLLLPDDHAAIAPLRKGIHALLDAKFDGRLPKDKLCLRETEGDRPEYDGVQVLFTNCKPNKKPIVIGADGSSVIASEADSAIYPGCRVNAKVRLWPQNNGYGKRVNAELIAIQFAGDDEPLTDSYVSVEDAMSGFGGASQDDEIAF